MSGSRIMQDIAGDDFVQQMQTFLSIQSFQRLVENINVVDGGKMSGEIVPNLLSKNKNTRLELIGIIFHSNLQPQAKIGKHHTNSSRSFE